VNVSLTDTSSYGMPLQDVDMLPDAVSDDLVVRLIGAAFARMPLDVGEIRDIRIVAFVLDLNSRLSRNGIQKTQLSKTLAVVVDDRLGTTTGLSNKRVERAVSQLLEARILERTADDPPHWFRFSRAVIQPNGPDQYVDWAAVIGKVAGHGPAVLLLRAVLDLVIVPWEWTRLTYDQLAARASYSLGMAQRGVAQLLELGILERADHSGRGHDYRLTTWALGRGPAVISERTTSVVASPENIVRDDAPIPASVKTPSAAIEAATSVMAVEIGGLVLRVPVGTEIRMTVGPNGETQYQVGSELRISPRG
jgi:hypothetical protein